MNQALISSLESYANELSRLPQVGRKNAYKILYYLLRNDPESFDSLSRVLKSIKNELRFCKECGGFTKEPEVCSLCSDTARQTFRYCLVETPFDIIKLERVKVFNGLYWVLHGKLNPLEGILPQHIRIEPFMKKIRENPVQEIVFAFSWDMESEATIRYIVEKIKALDLHIKMFRLSMGIPVGTEFQIIDELSIKNSFENLYEIH